MIIMELLYRHDSEYSEAERQVAYVLCFRHLGNEIQIQVSLNVGHYATFTFTIDASIQHILLPSSLQTTGI